MKKTRLLTVLAMVLALTLCLSACVKDPAPGTSTPSKGTEPAHVCQHECPVCGKCTDPDCKDEVCQDKCPGHEEENLPEIKVNPETLEINAGDEIDLLFGVSVTDSTDENPRLIILDDDGFDAEVEGVYTITYKAINKDNKEATATRTITVLKARSSVTLEVRENKLGENKWQGKLISFKNQLYVELTGSAAYDQALSGVFHNNSNEEITLSVSGGYGVAAIIDKNGVVIEGRDGANAKLVNAQNPARASSTVTTMVVDGEEVSVASAFAKNMTIPAGGYAIVVQSNYAGTGVDNDGRGYMNYNVIYSVGNVVRLYWTDTEENMTTYEDQAPVISGTNTTVYAGIMDTGFNLEESVLAGVVAKDDNGTFAVEDDLTVDITVTDNGGFDINVAGQYTITLTAKDANGNTTTATRVVEVIGDIVEICIDGNSYKAQQDSIAIDKDLTALGNYLFVIYTPEYNGTLNWANGFGEAFVLDQNGRVVRIYDGANGKYFDTENPKGIQDATKCTPAGYLKEAFESLSDTEYLLVAPNGNGNVSRKFLLDNRTIGAVVALPGIFTDPASQGTTLTIGDKVYTVEAGKWAINAEITAATAVNHSVWVFNKDYTGEFATNGYGVALVLDQYGTLIKVYDGANVGYWTVDGKAASAHFAAATYATTAHAELGEGETLVVLPNGGSEGNAARAFGLNCRSLTGQKMTINGITFETAPEEQKMTLTLGDKVYTAEAGKWAINAEITAATSVNHSVWVFNKDYTGEFATNGYGVALVLDRNGALIKVYDGANVGYWTVDGKAASAHFTAATYATTAYAELGEGETLVVLTNGGSEGNAARAFGLNCRSLTGQKMTITGIDFAE